jgi:steroid delta-isomerase-like uncharacterized protein
MQTDATRTLIEELLEAYNAPDLDRAALLYAEDCRYVNRAYGIEVKGRDGQRANMQAFLARFPDRKLRPLRVIADEGGAAVEAEFVATSPGGPGLPPAGQPYGVEMCCVFEIRDGLVATEHDYIDRPTAGA